MPETHLPALLASDLFDADFYAAEVALVFSGATEAARHYLREGWMTGANPSPRFDTRYYLRLNPDVRDAGVNPLAHYIVSGKAEGRRPRIGHGDLVEKPKAPTGRQWQKVLRELRSATSAPAGAVAVIVPVYKGYDDTLACLYSVVTSSNKTPYILIVVNDCSPDPILTAALRDLSARGAFTLVENVENLGFVQTVNRGMTLAGRRDVLLLNSDTIVYGDWLDRMKAHSDKDARVSTVTPMSNNATIFSYPYSDNNNNQRLEVDFSTLDSFFSAENRGKSIVVPTGVGFCFYITRDSLDRVGLFDADMFGKGYGEENDFCMRCSEAGFLNVAALDVFVRHTGEISFSASAQAGKDIAQRALASVHSRYLHKISQFASRDPFMKARCAIDFARVRNLARGDVVIHVDHGWGGGTERHIVDLETYLAKDGVTSFRLRLSRDGKCLSLALNQPIDLPNLPLIQADDAAALAAALAGIGATTMHIHSLIGFSYAQMETLVEVAKTLSLKTIYTAHDYAPICPRIQMIDQSGSYCASPSIDYCVTCIEANSTPFGDVDIHAWRAKHKSLLQRMDAVFVPHADVGTRLVRYLCPEIEAQVRTHPRGLTPPTGLVKAPPSGLRTVGVIGAIGPHKGAGLLYAMITDALARELPLRFVVYGHTSIPEIAELPTATVTGQYDERSFEGLLRKHPSDVALYLSSWPETFCYTLDLAIEAGIFPVSFDLGAPAARIRALKWGEVVPLSWMYSASIVNDYLVALDIPNLDAPLIEAGREWIGAEAYYRVASG